MRLLLNIPLFLFLAACSAEPVGSSEVVAAEPSPRFSLVAVTKDLENPVAISHAGDGSGRLFVTLQAGKIVILKNGQMLSRPFLDISTLVSCCGEQGLLGLAFHPDYETNGFFYVNYTDTSGDTVVARYSKSGDPNVANAGSALVLLRIDQPFSNHNGGHLAFGPDGFLYIGMGDGGSGGDPGNRAQNLSTLLGKMLRIDVDGGTPYRIPPDNPFVGRAGARGEIWAWGLRNPWRYSFDRQTGDLWIGDVGQNAWEEVHLQPASSRGGENYGWRLMEGNHCFNPSSNCSDGTLQIPILEYNHSDGCSITGGHVYRGSRYPNLRGTYLYGDYCSGTIWGARPGASGSWISTVLLETELSISTFGEDEAGEVYVADHNGSVYRIVDTNAARRRPARR